MIWIASLFLAVLGGGPQARTTDIEVVVYFASDSTSLNQMGLETLDSTANMLRSASGPLRVEGHTPTLGGDAYNVGLAQRRAQTVRDALIARGVADARIATVALGETAPARRTADGVDEPLNDRVVIRMQRPTSGR